MLMLGIRIHRPALAAGLLVCGAGLFLRPALAAKPSADELAARAWQSFRQGDDETARQHLEQALVLEPNHFKANELAGWYQNQEENTDRTFDHWLRLLGHDNPELPHYLRRLYKLNLDDAQRATYVRALGAMLEDADRPLLRTLATFLLADALRDAGSTKRADALYEQVGHVTDWAIIGPFNNERNSGFNRVFEPEETVDFQAQYEGRIGKVRWHRLARHGVSGLIDLAAVLYPRNNVLAYALGYVHAERETSAVIRFAAEKSVKLWVNDQLLFSDDQDRGFRLDRHEVPVRLQAGPNKILLKVCASDSNWRLALRITDGPGRGRSDLRFSTEPVETPDWSGREKPDAPFTRSMLGHFEQAVAEAPDDEDALYYLALAAGDMGDHQLAIKTLERLTEKNPKPSIYHTRLAFEYWSDNKPEKALVQMNRALTEKPDDFATLSLLGRFYQTRGLLDKARETLARARAQRANSLFVQESFRRVYLAEGWDQQVYLIARRNHRRAPEVPWVLLEYAQAAAARGYRSEAIEVYETLLERDHDNYGARLAIAQDLQAKGRVDEAEQELEKLQRLYPLRNDLRLRRARFLAQNRQFELALARCREALAVCPTDPEIHRSMGDVYERMDRLDDALSAWEDALTYKPADQNLREYVDFLRPAKNTAFARFGISEQEAERIRGQRVDPADHSKAGAVVLLDHLVTQLFEDGSSTSLEHTIVQILNETGRAQYTQVPLASSNPNVRRAVVIGPDGAETEATKITDEAIHFDKIQTGSILEYAVVYYQAPSSWLSRHYTSQFLFQGPNHMLRSQWILVSPPGKGVRYHLTGEGIQVKTGAFEGQNTHEFLMTDSDQLETETNRPPLRDIVRHVRVSTIDSWDEIARWEHSLIKDQFQADPQLKRTVGRLTASCKTREEKIHKLATYVAQEIQYKILHGGIFGIKPHRASNVLENQWGDCKDKATLLITMLRSAGISAHYVTLLTRDAGTFLPEIPYNQCNHAIIYIPGEENFESGTWIDGTAQYHGAGTLPWNDQGVRAMVFLDDGSITFLDTPVAAPGDNTRDFTMIARLDPDGNAEVRTDWHVTGQEAATFRQTFYQEGNRAEILTGFINRLIPGARLTDFSFNDLTDRAVPVRIRTRFFAPQLARKIGDKLTINPRHVLPMTAQFTARDVRYYDLFFQYPKTVHYRESYEIPEGYAPDGLPEPVEIDNPYMHYRHRAGRDGRTVTLEKTLTLKVLSIPKEKYRDLRAFCFEVDQHERKTIELTPEPAPAVGSEVSGK